MKRKGKNRRIRKDVVHRVSADECKINFHDGCCIGIGGDRCMIRYRGVITKYAGHVSKWSQPAT